MTFKVPNLVIGMIAYPLFSLHKAFCNCSELHRNFPHEFFVPSSNIFSISLRPRTCFWFILLLTTVQKNRASEVLTGLGPEFWWGRCWSGKTLLPGWRRFSAHGHWFGSCMDECEFLKSFFQNRLLWKWSLSSGSHIINVWVVLIYQGINSFSLFKEWNLLLWPEIRHCRYSWCGLVRQICWSLHAWYIIFLNSIASE